HHHGQPAVCRRCTRRLWHPPRRRVQLWSRSQRLRAAAPGQHPCHRRFLRHRRVRVVPVVEGDLMRTRGGVLVANIIAGLALGYTVANIGYGDYAELNRMFTFQDLRMLLAFAGAVVIIVMVFAVLRVRRTPGRIHGGVIPGAVMFGTGWAISGGCPAIPIIQVASGYLPALITIAGVIIGMWLCHWANSRYFHLDRGSCGL